VAVFFIVDPENSKGTPTTFSGSGYMLQSPMSIFLIQNLFLCSLCTDYQKGI